LPDKCYGFVINPKKFCNLFDYPDEALTLTVGGF